MKTKFTMITLFGFFVYLFLSPSMWGAIIMTDDGNTLNYFVDGEQSIKINTPKGVSVVKFKDVIWMAGKGNKKIRLSSNSIADKIIGGTTEDIEVKKGVETKSLSSEQIIFFYNGDIDLEGAGKLVLEEFNGIWTLSTFTTGDTEKLKIELLPENWEDIIKISNPIYPNKVSSSSCLNIEFNTEVETPFLYKDMKLLLMLKLTATGGSLTTGRLFKSKGDLLKHRNSVCLPIHMTSFMMHGGVEFVGNGHFMLYIIGDQGKEVLGNGNLEIIKTMSNVLSLPITIEKKVGSSPK